MEGGGGGDEDRVNVLGLDDVINRSDRGSDLDREIHRRLGHGVGDVGDLGLAGCCNGSRMHLADAASAQYSKTYHSVSPDLGRVHHLAKRYFVVQRSFGRFSIMSLNTFISSTGAATR